jgi:osmotically-inducible protein OsmY
MTTSSTLEDEVIAAIAVDPRIPDALEIAVVADDGLVTLRGTVERFAQRRAAVHDTRTVIGVEDIDDQLRVSLGGSDRRADDEIRGIALQLLLWDVEVPDELIEVTVADGWVTLKGEVSYQFESDAVYDDVASLYGVVGITNEIRVVGV